MPPSILSQTRSLIRLYRHIAGESEVPQNFHIWSCLSMISAAVQDRVWIEKHRDRKLVPNLYVFLVGPGALGKGVAIDMATTIFSQSNTGFRIYNGSLTRAHLIDVLGKTKDRETGEVYVPNPKLWIVQDELRDDIGAGKIAQDMVTIMTKLYTAAGSEVPVDTGTRTHGEIRVVNPVINWLAGTTEEWMIDALTKEFVGGGAAARIVYVKEDYQDKRLVRPIYPHDYEEVRAHVLTRFWLLSRMSGKFYMTPNALAREHKWYMDRKMPKEKELWASWRREQDLVLKLAMLVVLGDGEVQLVIREPHIVRAIKLSQSVQRFLPGIITSAYKTPETSARDKVEEMLRGEDGWVGHSKLAARARGRGISTHVFKQAMFDMHEDGLTEWRSTPTGAREYRWRGESC